VSATAPHASGIERVPPTFSVLIATYNHASYVMEALESVAAQGFTDYEVVVVDDGSTDETASTLAAWVRSYTRRFPNRVVISRIANQGQSGAYEHGLDLCTGRYVALLDSDDHWLPAKLEAVHHVVTTDPDAALIVHPVLVMGPNGTLTGRVRPSQAALSRGDLRERIRRTGRTVAAVTSGVTVRSDVLRALLPMPTKGFRFGADGYITLGASLRGTVEVIPKPLALYRIHPSGQYVARMLSEHGPRLTMEHQLIVARHFGLENAIRRSSYFGRHAFAAAKLEGDFLEQVRSYGRLLRSTALDESFSLPARLALAAFWTACLATPRRSFFELWKWFQLWHTGADRVMNEPVHSPRERGGLYPGSTRSTRAR
jgi:glycosyltransferase involved in cell wall biosynthesis